MLSRALRPRARAAALATSRISRTLATKPAGGSSPFAPPPEPEAGDGKLTRYEELKQRQDEMAKMMQEKTMLEVNNAAKVWWSRLQPNQPYRQARLSLLTLTPTNPRPVWQGRRPEGIHHVLGKVGAAC